MTKRELKNTSDTAEYALIRMPHIIRGSYFWEYFKDIISSREDPARLKKIIGDEGKEWMFGLMREQYQNNLQELEQKVFHPAIEDIMEGIERTYGRVNGEEITTRVIYQARKRNGHIIDGSLHGNQATKLINNLAPECEFGLDEIPKLVGQPSFPKLEKIVLSYIRKERKGGKETYEPEILCNALEIEFPRGHPSGIDRIILSLKVGEKLPMKTTSVIYGKRGEPIADVMRARIIIDSNACTDKGKPLDVVKRAYDIFYHLFPFFNKEILSLGKGERGYLPEKRKNGESGFLDSSRILSVLNVRRQLDPEFKKPEVKKILAGPDQIPPEEQDRRYQYLKGGFFFNGLGCKIDKSILKPELAEGYLPAIEIQVTTSNRHRTNEEYGQTCKETYTLFDMAKTMVEEEWTEEMFDTYSMLVKSNILGTRYNGPVPDGSEYSMIHKRAEAIWRVLVPKVKRFYNPDDKKSLYRRIQKELELSKNLKYYL